MRVPVSPYSHQHFSSVFLIIRIVMGVKLYFIVILICISLMSNDKLIFMRLLTVCVSSLEKSLLKSFAQFLTGLIIFLSWSCKGYSYILVDPFQIYDFKYILPNLLTVFSLS